MQERFRIAERYYTRTASFSKSVFFLLTFSEADVTCGGWIRRNLGRLKAGKSEDFSGCMSAELFLTLLMQRWSDG